MNSVKITYMVLQFLSQCIFLALAILSPIFITPGWYWWTVFSIIMMCLNSHSFSMRVNSWKDMGEI